MHFTSVINAFLNLFLCLCCMSRNSVSIYARSVSSAAGDRISAVEATFNDAGGGALKAEPMVIKASIESLTLQSIAARSARLKEPPYWPRYHGQRQVLLLDGLWNTSCTKSTVASHDTHFDVDIDNKFDSMDQNFDPATIETLEQTQVPVTVDNTLPGYMGYRGVSFFRTILDLPISTTYSGNDNDNDYDNVYGNEAVLPEIGPAKIQFQACSFFCRIWINNKEIGSHKAGGYVAFSLDVPKEILQLSQMEVWNGTSLPSNTISTEIFVLVDNRFNATTAPLHTGGDFWHYGGILRSVEWHVLPQNPLKVLWPWRLYVYPQQDLQSIHVKLHLTNNNFEGMINSPISIWFDDANPKSTNLRHQSIHNRTIGIQNFPSGTVRTISPGIVDLGILKVPNPRIWWTTRNPQLHTISIEVNGGIVQERFGLRYWDIKDSRIRLNGEILKLVGWNHHTQFPQTAASPTDAQLDFDIDLLKQGNINFVRGAHYPQDPRWLDRLDEQGFVMWCETLGPAVSVENLQDERFLQYQEQQVNEMLDSALNHASIAFWGFFNEGPSESSEACPGYLASSKVIQRRDPTRFITYASNTYPPYDLCYDAATVISYNGYPGWYQDADPATWWNRIANDLMAGKPANALGKPLVISETGAAGIYEWINSTTNDTNTMWTIPYQTKVILEDVENALNNTNISGIALWHFFDFKVDDKWENNTHCDYLPDVQPPTCGYIAVNTSKASGRPGGANHKGVLDFFRRPKPVYKMVAALYAKITKDNDFHENMELNSVREL